ncbi:hypothetical protein BDK51DRAFT_28009, partial [Blyttiomyces helicus]
MATNGLGGGGGGHGGGAMPTGGRGSNGGHGSSRPHNDGTGLIKAEILRVDKEVKEQGQPVPGDPFAEVLYYIRPYLAEKVHAPSGCLEHITMLGPYPSNNGPREHAPMILGAANMSPAGRAPVPRPTTQYQPVAPFAFPAPAVALPVAAPPAAPLAPPPVSHPRTATTSASHSIPPINSSSHSAPAPHRPYSRAPAPPASGFSSKSDEKRARWRNTFHKGDLMSYFDKMVDTMNQMGPHTIKDIPDLLAKPSYPYSAERNGGPSQPRQLPVSSSAHVPPPVVPAATKKVSPPVLAADAPVPAEDTPVPVVDALMHAPTQPADALPVEPPKRLAIRLRIPASVVSKPDAASSSGSASRSAPDLVVAPAPRKGSASRKGSATTTERDINKDLKEDSRKRGADDVDSAHKGAIKKQRPSVTSEEGEKKARERAKAEAEAARDGKSKK